MHGAKRRWGRRGRRRRRRRAKCGKAMPDTYHFKMEWGRKERRREREIEYRRADGSPLRAKARFFLHLPPLATPLFITPWFFVPSPCASPSTFIYQFFFSLFFFTLFSPLARSHTLTRRGRGWKLETTVRAKGRF